jgi:spore germination protein YaaH
MAALVHVMRWVAMAAACWAPIQASAASSPAIMAYYTGGSLAPIKAEIGVLTQLPTDSFDVTAAGAIQGTAPTQALALAKAHGIQTFATISNYGVSDFSPAIAHALLNEPAAVNTFVANTIKLLNANGYNGVNIDFEGVPPKDRAAYTSFVGTLVQAAHKAGHSVVLSVPAELKDDPSDSWAGAFDFAALGQTADLLQLMTYDENGPWGPPGPVAGLDWVTASATYAVSVVPPGKISLGMPAYGYDWNLTRGTGVSVAWKDIPALLTSTGAKPQWDRASSSPYFNYTAANGARHVVWYENARSIPLKAHLAVSKGLAGVSVWALGLDNAGFWRALQAGL